jgi:hypothetical protein
MIYSIGTWDTEVQAFTPQDGLTVPSLNIEKSVLREALRQLRREHGYPGYRFRDENGDYHSDWAVLIERTDGMSEAEILEGWKR